VVELNSDKVSAVLLRAGDWIKVREGTFTIDEESGLFQFDEAHGGTVTTTVVGRVADVVATKRKSGEPQTRVSRAVFA